MSLERNRTALAALQPLLMRFQEALKRKTEGARFQSSDDRSDALVEQVRLARHHLSLAIDALEGGQRTPALDETSAWLRDRVQGLVGYLSGAKTPPEPTPGMEENQSTGVLAGEGEVLAIPELIAALHAQGRSGVLKVEHPEETIELHFWSGELGYARSHSTPVGMRLGEILVRRGSLSELELKSALAQFVGNPEPLGWNLIRGGWITESDLSGALEEQARGLFHRIGDRPRSSYVFEPGLPPGNGKRAAWNVNDLLMEGRNEEDDAA